MKKLRLSAQLNLYPRVAGEGFGEFLKNSMTFNREVGFDAVDFSMDLLGLSATGWEARAELAKQVSEDVGMRYAVCHLPFGSQVSKTTQSAEVFNEQMHRAIDAAALFGVEHAVLHPNSTTLKMRDFDRAAQYDLVMSHLAPFAEHAARVGVSLALENMRVVPSFVPVHRYCQSPEDLCRVADALGIGVCWDFGHAHISGIQQSEGLAYVGNRLRVIHIHDNFATEDEHILPFTGTVDWRDAMHGLALVGYEGLLNLELAAGRVPAVARRPFAQYAVAAATELMEYIE